MGAIVRKIEKSRITTVLGYTRIHRVSAALQPTLLKDHGLSWVWVVPFCPFCGQIHSHGVTNGLAANPFARLGLRSAHCKNVERDAQRKYFLVYAGLAPFREQGGPKLGKFEYVYQSNPDRWLAEMRGKLAEQANVGANHEQG